MNNKRATRSNLTDDRVDPPQSDDPTSKDRFLAAFAAATKAMPTNADLVIDDTGLPQLRPDLKEKRAAKFVDGAVARFRKAVGVDEDDSEDDDDAESDSDSDSDDAGITRKKRPIRVLLSPPRTGKLPRKITGTGFAISAASAADDEEDAHEAATGASSDSRASSSSTTSIVGVTDKARAWPLQRLLAPEEESVCSGRGGKRRR